MLSQKVSIFDFTIMVEHLSEKRILKNYVQHLFPTASAYMKKILELVDKVKTNNNDYSSRSQ